MKSTIQDEAHELFFDICEKKSMSIDLFFIPGTESADLLAATAPPMPARLLPRHHVSRVADLPSSFAAGIASHPVGDNPTAFRSFAHALPPPVLEQMFPIAELRLLAALTT